jgi:hypothetical protein
VTIISVIFYLIWILYQFFLKEFGLNYFSKLFFKKIEIENYKL